MHLAKHETPHLHAHQFCSSANKSEKKRKEKKRKEKKRKEKKSKEKTRLRVSASIE